MAAPAQSFLVSGNASSRLARELSKLARSVERPGGAVVFLSGDFAEQLPEVAREVAPSLQGIPTLFATGAGVLSDAGELEAQSGASGVVWRGKPSPVFCVDDEDAEACIDALAGQVFDHAARADHPSLVFVGPQLSEATQRLHRDGRGRNIFGAGAVHSPGVATVDGDGRVRVGSAAAMVLSGVHSPKVHAAPACRVLDAPQPVTLSRGPLILELGGEPALDYLGRVAESIADASLVLAAVFESDHIQSGKFTVKPIRGVDPSRGAVVLPEALADGAALGFAVRDAAMARDELTRSAFSLKRELAGAMPLFGLHLTCAGRGVGLYGNPDVEIGVMRRAFPGVPLAGMMSAFELPPGPEGPTLALYTAVTAMFATPS
ncbi:MAG TPA: FIST C-terminal domain-containing protein [Polyangiaceae bacterium]|nr:FIST C-terminal domain-containing protein [Polyangiaceae bacterium]